MSLFQAIVLGAIQGITEFLPISSSGHLIFLPIFFGWSDQGLAFDAVVHLGTLVAVVWYFRKRLLQMMYDARSRGTASATNRRFAWLLFFTVIPAGLVGWFLSQWIEQYARSASVVAWSLIVWGIVLFFADWYGRTRKQHVDTYHLSFGRIVFVACAQAIALIPGTSRSGITMTAGLFAGLDRKSAAEFSFLMSVPIIALAGMVKLIAVFRHGFPGGEWLAFVVGFFAAAASGWIAITFFMKIIARWSFTPFVVYRILMGAAILLFV